MRRPGPTGVGRWQDSRVPWPAAAPGEGAGSKTGELWQPCAMQGRANAAGCPKKKGRLALGPETGVFDRAISGGENCWRSGAYFPQQMSRLNFAAGSAIFDLRNNGLATTGGPPRRGKKGGVLSYVLILKLEYVRNTLEYVRNEMFQL